jgi:hypothetical protein
LILLTKLGFKLVNHECIGHKLVDYNFLSILTYYTHFSDKLRIKYEFYKFVPFSEIPGNKIGA